jgi:hypothetical protein
MKGVFYHTASGRWASKIGFKHTKSAERTNAIFYFAGAPGDEPPHDVIADVITKQREWKHIKSDWATIRPMLEEISPDTDWSMPVWYKPENYTRPIDIGDEIKAVNKMWNDGNLSDRRHSSPATVPSDVT